MKEKDPDLYMRGMYYLLVFLYFAWDREQYAKYLHIFEAFEASVREQLNTNSQMIAFVYLYLSKLNLHMMSGEYDKGIKLIPEIETAIETYKSYTDIHRILLFYFKFAYLYFAKSKYNKALEYLNEVIMLQHGRLREDLHHNARLLQIICHFELGNYDLLSYLASSVKRAFGQAKDVSQIQRLTLDFIRKLVNLSPSEHREAFEDFQAKTAHLADSPYERKALLYLDIPAWVQKHLKPLPTGNRRSNAGF